TAADGQWILSLDGAPALGVFRSVVPEPLLAEPRRALAVVLAGLVTDEGGFVARHLVGLDVAREAIAVASPVSVGQELFFGVRDPLAARETLDGVLAEQAAAWPGPGPRAAVCVHWLGRG